MAASEGQVKFMETLFAQRAVPDNVRAHFESLSKADEMTPGKFSSVIDMLKGMPYADADKPLLTEGIYMTPDGPVKVQRSKGSGKCYALTYEPMSGRWDYAGGLIYRLEMDTPRATVQDLLPVMGEALTRRALRLTAKDFKAATAALTF